MTQTTSSQPHSPTAEPIDSIDDTTAGDLKRFGIRAHEHTSSEWNGYRYTNSSDAIAAARRAAK